MAYTTITRLTFRTNLRSRLGNSLFWTDDELNASINEALRTWNLLTGTWCAKYIVPLTAGQNWVTLPSTMTSSTRMAFMGRPLKTTALRDLDNGAPGWEMIPGQPTYWSPVALNLIAVYPADTVSGNPLTVDGIRNTPTLGDDADYVDLDQGSYDLLLNYARHVLLLKLGGREFTESLAAHAALLEAAGRTNQRIQASAPYRKVMGAPLDSTRQPHFVGAQKAGIR